MTQVLDIERDANETFADEHEFGEVAFNDFIAFRMDALREGVEHGLLGGPGLSRRNANLLLSLLEEIGWYPDENRLIGALPHLSFDFGMPEIQATLSRLGLPVKSVRLTGRTLSKVEVTSLVSDTDGNVLILNRDVTPPVLTFYDEAQAEWRRQSILPRAYYEVVSFRAATEGEESATPSRVGWTRELIARLAPELRLQFMLSLFANAIAVVAAFGIMLVFDTAVPTRNVETLAWIGVALFGLLLLEFVVRRLLGSVIARVSARVECLVSNFAFSKLMRLPPEMVMNQSVSSQVSRLRQFENIRELPSSPLMQTLSDVPVAVMLLTGILVLAPQLALIAAAILVVVAVVVGLVAYPLRRAARLLGEAQGRLIRQVQDIIRDRVQIMRFGLTAPVQERTWPAIDDLVSKRMRYLQLTQWLDTFAAAISPLAASVVIGAGALLVIRGGLSPGQLIACTILTWRLFAIVQQVPMQLKPAWDTVGLLDQLDRLTQLPESPADEPLGPSKPIEDQTLRALQLTHRYPRSVAPVLVNANFEVLPGEMVGVCGPVGSGKSTLLQFIAGIQPPQAGAVRLGLFNIAQLPPRTRNAYLVYVSQTPALFYGTVAQNLRFHAPLASDARLTDALDEVGLSDWLSGLSNGLQTRIDPSRDSAILPPGVNAALSVAGAILTRPQILLLDDITGSLDRNLESHLMSALMARSGEMTSILVTHRPSILRQMDKILRLQDGRVQVLTPRVEEKVAS